jgi:hypothetical protein
VREKLVDLARRDHDALQHVAFTQQSDDQLIAHLVAVIGVVDPLLRKRRRQVGKGDAVARRDVLQCRVQSVVGDRDAVLLRLLQLDFLQDQAVQHLLAQHALGRRGEPLGLQFRDHLAHAVVELALHDHAVVDNRGDTVEQHTLGREVAGLGERPARQQREHRRRAQRSKPDPVLQTRGAGVPRGLGGEEKVPPHALQSSIGLLKDGVPGRSWPPECSRGWPRREKHPALIRHWRGP